MQSEDVGFREVIGVLGKGYQAKNENWCSMMPVYLEREISEDGLSYTYSEINKNKEFCSTKTAFLTSDYMELKSRFGENQLLIFEANQSTKPDGECRYAVYHKRVRALKPTELIEIIDVGSGFSFDAPSILVPFKPSTQFVMLKAQDPKDGKFYMYGPCEFHLDSESEYGGQISLSWPKCPLPGRKIPDQNIGRICMDDTSDMIVSTEVNSARKEYLCDYALFSSRMDFFDIIDDDTLIKKYAEDILKFNGFEKISKRSIEVLRKNIFAGKQYKQERQRYLKVVKLLEHVPEWQSEREKLISSFFSSSEGVEVVNRYLSENESKYFHQYRQTELNKIEEELETKRAEISRLEKRQTEIKLAIREASVEAEKIKDSYRRISIEENARTAIKIQEDMANECAGLGEEKRGLIAEIDALKKKHSKLQTYDKLDEKVKNLEDDYGSLIRQTDKLKETKASLQQEVAKEINTLTDSYIKMQAQFVAMTKPVDSPRVLWSFDSPPVKKLIVNDKPLARNEYVDNLHRSLAKHGRFIEREKLINLLVTIAQNQFTIFAGLPGTGKTSLVKRLGLAMNLGRRQHTIPVARGWTSSRDVLGYWNSLSGKFHSSPTGLWELLQHVQNESMTDVSPILLLLDEMNLSSPEHYFSSFLDLADGESTREVLTGDPSQPYLFIPEYLRIIGTVNSDETVNGLSPRMIDRSAVIIFDDVCDLSSENCDFSRDEDALLDEPISANDWLELFRNDEGYLTPQERTILESIIEALSENNDKLGQRILVSYRKRMQVNNYVAIARPLLSEYDEFYALDKAVQQYVLPMITGFGEPFSQRLEKLLIIMQRHGLNSSLSSMQHIIQNGKNRLNTFRFMV